MLREYQQINESFEKTLVFHLGSRSGFFSEYNCMLLCMLYCLQNKIKFQLYSHDLSIAVSKGWTDFFEPFCPETSNILHRLFNTRFPRTTPQFKLRKSFGPLVKFLSNCDFLTYELWNDFRALSEQTSAHHLSLTTQQPHSLREACRQLIAMTWRFKPEIEEEIKKDGSRTGLPEKYLAVHIRAGDKIKEYEGSPISAYMNKLQSLSSLRDLLVMTDDYRVFEQLKHYHPNWKLHTLESPKLQGYQHRKNKRLSPSEKRQGTIRFFAGIELASKAEYFVGTFSSNIGTYLGMRMNPERCHAVDFDHWRI